MVSVETGIGARWAGLAAVAEPDRSREMRDFLEEVIALGDSEKSAGIEQMVMAEYALPEAALRSFTVSRLRTWLAIAHDDLVGAISLARGYDAAFDKLGAAMAMRRSSLVQAVARHDLKDGELEGLFDLIPSLVRQVPRRPVVTRYYEKPEPKKAFWKFW